MDFSALKNAVDEAVLVDAHAHNLVAAPFIDCFSQAHGDASPFVPHSLSFKRNLREIVELYDCEPSLKGVEEHRKSLGLDSICSTCFKAARISAILIDDGLELDKNKHNIEWHRKFVPIVGRISRIERLAENILDEEFEGGSSWTLDAFTQTFLRKLKSLADEVYGLKSVAAYRSGLEIDVNVSRKDAEKGLIEVLRGGKPVRIASKSLIDYIFIHSLEVAQEFNLPMQIDTGFGDRHLDLRLANPLHLRKVLEDKRFSKCCLVLLHASYPFSKEASYLASIYPQVYLDFGLLTISKLSVHGMISTLKQLLELAPIKKVMFSTDAYAFPETYYLGAKKSREAVFSVLRDACIDGDLSISEAVEAVNDIFAQNAINLYKKINRSSIPTASIFSSPRTKPDVVQNDVKFVRIMWVDASGQHRCRVVPSKRFNDVIKRNGAGTSSVSAMGFTSYADNLADGSNLISEITLLVPDLSTKCMLPWNKHEEMVLGDMHLRLGEPWEYCPREALRRVSRLLKDEFDLESIAGFEIEFYLLKKVTRDNGKEDWVPIDLAPYCSTSSYDAASPFLHEVVASLNSLNITVEQFHAEGGKGQFEVVLGYGACLNAVNDLVYTHEVIKATAQKHGMLATFMPKYALDDFGSGSHVHLSLWRNGKNVFMASDGSSSKHGISAVGEEFMAGVLHHISSILAFTAPLPNSYDRIQPNTWSGAYNCWGKENKEAPIRTASAPGVLAGSVSNFEFKAFDGCANPHLGLAAIIFAGLDGLRNHLQLPEPIDENPHSLGSKVQRLPQSLSESLEALEKNKVLTDLIGEKLVDSIMATRKAEVQYYSKHPDAYKQLIHRY